MLKVTEAAVEQIRTAALQGRAVGMALRVAARLADDGSIEYGMGFDDTHEDDAPIEFDGLTVVVAATSRPLLQGTTLDWVELEPGQRRFIFVPPDAAPDAAPEQAADAAAQRPAAGGCGSGGCSRCGG